MDKREDRIYADSLRRRSDNLMSRREYHHDIYDPHDGSRVDAIEAEIEDIEVELHELEVRQELRDFNLQVELEEAEEARLAYEAWCETPEAIDAFAEEDSYFAWLDSWEDEMVEASRLEVTEEEQHNAPRFDDQLDQLEATPYVFESPQTKVSRQRWEYCRVWGWEKGSVLRAYTLDGPDQVSLEAKTVEALVAELGREGWEAYAVADTSHYLKRSMK
jgi:hypothetical protein